MKTHRCFTLASVVLALFFGPNVEVGAQERPRSAPEADPPSRLGTQNTVPPLPGARLRVTAPTLESKPLVGTLVEITDHELVLAVPGRGRTAIPVAAVLLLEVSRGRCRWCAVGQGLLFGAVGFGGMVPPALAFYGEGSAGGGYWLLALPVAGAALGVARGNRERWETVAPGLDGLRPAQRGLGQAGLGDVLVGPVGKVGASVAAQDTVSPLSGALLRVTAPTVMSKPLVGTLVETTDRELVAIAARDQRDRTAIPIAAVSRLELSRGRHRNTLKGLIMGAAVGASLGLAAAASIEGGTSSPDHVAVAALVGAGLGATPGAVLGALTKTDRWVEIPVSNLRVTSAPVKGDSDLAEAAPGRQVRFSITPTNDRGVQARFSISWR